MINRNLLIIAIILLLNCGESDLNEKHVVSRYQNLIKALEDSVLAAEEDTSSVNPILAKLSAKYNWNEEQKNWQRNPFVPRKVNIKPKVVKTKKLVINEARGLLLSGIIQKGSIKKALINGQLYKRGDRVRNLIIVEIGKKHVTLRGFKNKYNLYLKEK